MASDFNEQDYQNTIRNLGLDPLYETEDKLEYLVSRCLPSQATLETQLKLRLVKAEIHARKGQKNASRISQASS